jgi:hypothetical protein
MPLICSAQIADSLKISSALSDSGLTAYADSTMKKANALDTLLSDSSVNAWFRKYATIENQILISETYDPREVPSIKEIQQRKLSRKPWLFWIIAGILLYIGGVRTFNQKNFKASLNSVFSMKFTSKLWEERGVIFNYITLQLFSIFVLVCALFLYVCLYASGLIFFDGAVIMYLALAGLLFVVYALKFLLHYAWGWMFHLNKFGLSMVSNIVTTSNFISLMVLPVLIALIYINYPLMEQILTRTIIVTFILSVAYRVVRSLVLSGTYFHYPLVYLILYLCIFEISPWIIIINLISE